MTGVRLAAEAIRGILSEGPRTTIDDPSLTPAGVMLILYSKDGELCVLLNRRTEQVEYHKGEISFPGGQRDDGDDDLLQTALRETYEEMGIRPEDVDVLGQVEDTPTSTRFLISTYVGTIPYPYDFRPSEAEVAEVLEIPLSTLMYNDVRRDEIRVAEGRLVNSPTFAAGGHLVFGATGRIFSRFLDMLCAAKDEEAPWTTSKPLR